MREQKEERSKMSLLNKGLGIGASAIPVAEFVFYKNSAPNTPAERILETAEPIINNSNLTPYVGNFPECFAIPLVSGVVGDYIEEKGKSSGNRLVEKVGKYFPEVSTGALSTYFILGETILPQMLPGTADVKDLPAVLVSALAGYTLAKLGQKYKIRERIFSSARKIQL